MKAIINTQNPHKEIVVFDGEWTTNNPQAAEMMIESGKILFDSERLTDLFVDPIHVKL